MAVCKACCSGVHDKCEDVYDEETGTPRERDYRGCPCRHRVDQRPQESALPG